MNYYNENNPACAHWLRELITQNLIPPGHVDQRSIVDVTGTDLAGFTQCHFFAGIGGWSLALRLAGWPEDRPVWTGSCPCQPFSCAGQGKGNADPRHLWPQFFRLISACKPATCFGEQVASKAGRLWLSGVRADLETLAYAFGAADLCAAGVRAPHIRQRLFWVAQSDQGERGRLANGQGSERDGAEAGRKQSNGEPQPCGVTGGLDNTAGARCSGPLTGPEREARDQARVCLSGASIGTGGVEDSGPQPEGWRICGPSESVAATGERAPDQLGGSGRFSDWSNFDSIPCSDGKARRVESRFQLLDNGLPSRVEAVRKVGNEPIEAQKTKIEHAPKTSGDTDSVLPKMSTAADQEKVSVRSIAGLNSLRETQILQSDVHGAGNGGSNESPLDKKQLSPISESEQGLLRKMRQKEGAPCPPLRFEPHEQRAIELDNIVRVLPQAYSLAAYLGDTATIEALHLLFPSSPPQRTLQHSPFKDEATWRPPSREEVERAWKAGAFENWGWRPISPLAHSVPGRVGLLRGYGNSICPQLAAEFIQACEEAREALI